MIFTDGEYLATDSSQEELHRFARKIGLDKAWYKPGSFPRYDLVPDRKLRSALERGAIRLSSKEFEDRLRDSDF